MNEAGLRLKFGENQKKEVNRMKAKKGYIFTIDALMAIAAIVAGLIIIYSIGSKTPSTLQTSIYSEDIIALLANTRVYEVNNPYVDKLILGGDIQNSDNTLIEQAGEFYYRDHEGPDCTGDPNCINDCKCVLEMFIQNLTEGAIPPTYDFEMLIDNELVYETKPKNPDTEIITSSKRIISGMIDESNMWSYGAQIEVWQWI